MFLTNGEISISCLPRVGSHSIKQACPNWTCIEAKDVTQTKVIGFLRNPIERLKSAYSLYYWIYKRNENVSTNSPPREAFEDWPTFVDFALTHEDAHWRPQIELLSTDHYLPTVTHKFEDIMQYWTLYVQDGGFPWLNRVQHLKIDEYRMTDLFEFYEKDLIKWHGV